MSGAAKSATYCGLAINRIALALAFHWVSLSAKKSKIPAMTTAAMWNLKFQMYLLNL